jgi:uncharacterized protein YdeI (YjbR/CyaY-like superfamily)
MASSRKRPDESEEYKGLPILLFSTVRQWRAWLARNHDACDGLWVRLAKKDSTTRCISYIEARDQAIAYGWIDGLKNAIDEEFYAIRFTPRRKRSKWSKINCAVSERLIAEGAMAPPGMQQVQAAKADGRWEAAYAGSATIEVHPELERALAKNPAAKKFFATISAASRFAILYQVNDAKRPETRAKRIAAIVSIVARNLTMADLRAGKATLP